MQCFVDGANSCWACLGKTTTTPIERDDTNYPHYHRATDTVAHATWNQLRDICRVVVGQIVDYAVPASR